MVARQSTQRLGRDFFHLRAPADLFTEIPGDRPRFGSANASLVLDLQRREIPSCRSVVDGVTTPIIPFPAGSQALVRLATGTRHPVGAGGDAVNLLLPRETFDAITDEHGVPRLTTLEVKPGIAAEDSVMRHLGASLSCAVEQTRTNSQTIVDHIASALNLHIAQRYGDFSLPPRAERGGLKPWQLRLARNVFEEHLGNVVSIDTVARDCGLSTSHFSRAFACSTGLPPYQWLIQRRLNHARDLMLRDDTPLAQIAVACGFSDQSHFTRAFTAAIGLGPAQWRKRRRHLETAPTAS